MKSVRIRSFAGPDFPAFGPDEIRIGTLFTKCTFLNIDELSQLRRPRSSLFYSEIVEGKKEVFQKTMLYVENGDAVYCENGNSV